MNRLDTKLAQLRQESRCGLVCYFTAGDPDFATSLNLLSGLATAGADVIELGMPFSDPVADGPVIQSAHLRALAAGQTVSRTLELVREVRKLDAATPIMLMGYLNPVMQYGEHFMHDAAEAGVDGLILVDLPVEHATPYRTAADTVGLHLIRITAPTSDDARLAQVLQDASGFVYHVTLNGTTGANDCVPVDTGLALSRLRQHTDLPIAAGFGIRSTEQIQALASQADLVVIGSKLVETLEKKGMASTLDLVRQFASALRP